MKILLFAISITCLLASFENECYSQTTTTESKSCGSCNGAVSVNSKVGMYCPHCGGRWGYENETRETNYNTNSYNSPSSVGYGHTISNLNFRSSTSTNSTVYTTISKGTRIKILSTKGNWYYIEHSYYNGYKYLTRKGYVNASYVR